MTGMPNDYGLVEETDLNAVNSARRIPIKRRLLLDDEKIYGIQRLWTSANSKFVLVKKAEYSETNNNKAFADKFLFRSLTRQKSIDRGSHDGKPAGLRHVDGVTSSAVDLHAEQTVKQRSQNSLHPPGAMNGAVLNNNNNRTALSPTPPTAKNHQNTKRSLKTILSTLKS